MRFSTPCSRMRSSLVETSSPCSSFLAAGLAGGILVCAANAESGSARVEVTIEAVPVRKVRRGVFIFYISSMIMRTTYRTNTHKQYNSGGMPTVNRVEELGLAIERYLRSERCCKAWNQLEVVIVPGGIRLDSRQKFLIESRRLRLLAQQ